MVKMPSLNLMDRLLLRTVKANRAQFFAVVSAVVIGVMIFTGMITIVRSMEAGLSEYYERYQYAHLFVETKPLSQTVVREIRALDGVLSADGRVVNEVRASHPRGLVPHLRIVSYDERNNVNGLHLVSGRLPAGDTGISLAVLSGFAEANHLTVGDTLQLYVRGEPVRAVVSAIVDSPEYVYAVRDARNMFPDFRQFGVAFIPTTTAQALFGMEGRVNSVVATLRDETRSSELKDLIENRFKEYGVAVLERDNQISHVFIRSELDGISQVARLIPVVFIGLAALAVYLTVSRMVEAERISIGIMRALGYSTSTVVTHYVKYALLVGFCGSLLGMVAGYTFASWMLPFYMDYFHIPLARLSHHLLLYPLSLALACVPCGLSGLLAALKVTRLSPSEAMRPPAPDAGRHVLLESVAALWSRLETTTKMVLRGISRNQRRFIFTAVGTAFTYAIILMPTHSIDLFDTILAKHFGEMEVYDYTISFTSPAPDSVVRHIGVLAGASHAEPYIEEALSFEHGWRKEYALTRGTRQDSSLFRYVSTSGEPIQVPERGILISEFLAGKLGVTRGSVVLAASPRDPDTKHHLVVRDVVRQYLGSGVYVSLAQMEQILGDKQLVTGVALKSGRSLPAELRDAPIVAGIYRVSAIAEVYDEMMEISKYSLGVFILFGCILGFAVMFTTSSISLSERLREFATMRVLGFGRRHILLMIAKENMASLCVGIILGIPLGHALCVLMSRYFSNEMYYLPEAFLLWPHIQCVLVTLLFFGLVMLALWYRVRRLQFMDALKTRIS